MHINHVINFSLRTSLLFLSISMLLKCSSAHTSSFNFRFRKRDENKLCPMEYRKCLCNYTNTNRLVNSDRFDFNTKKTFSIMIDCTRHGSLERIPNITNRKSKRHYLKHITQLDLTRTNIDVVPTDAFHVSLIFYLSDGEWRTDSAWWIQPSRFDKNKKSVG